MSLQPFGILDRTLFQRRRHRRAMVLTGVSLAVVVLAMPARAQTIVYPQLQERTAPISLTSNTTLQTSGASSVQSGLISGGFSITKTGAGNLVLTGANTYSGGTIVQQGGLLLRHVDSLGTGSVSMMDGTELDFSAGVFDNDISVAGSVVLGTQRGGEVSSQITGTGSVIAQSRGGTLVTLSGDNTYAGGTTLHGFVGVGSDTAFGTGAVRMANAGLSYRANIALGNRLDATGDAYLQVDAGQARQDGVFREAGGTANLIKRGAGELVMTKANLYSGRTQVEAGTLTITANAGLSDVSDVTIASGATLNLDTGQTVRSLAGGGTLDLTGVVLDVGEDAADTEFSGTMVGGSLSGLRKFGGGKLTLSGNSAAYTGGLTAASGVLEINGDYSGASVLVAGGTLTGSGNLGDVGMSMGYIAGRAGQTLSMDELRMTAGSGMSVSLGAPNANALFNVRGDVILDGWINVQDAGGFGPGVYRILDYAGDLTYRGMYFDNLPTGVVDTDLELQLIIDGQVNIVSNATGTIGFWDGDNSALWNNGAIDGGSGTWSRTEDSFTNASGAVNDVMTPAPGFAIFQGPAGTVTIDNSDGQVAVTGMQFASNGYTVTGDSLELDSGDNIFRVGDVSAAGAGYTATINAELIGAGRLVKSDLGKLVLNNDNSSYAGGTEVRAGTLVVNGRIGDVEIGADGRLMGIGNVGNTTVAGTIAADNSIGTLHVDGDLIFDPTGIFEVEVDAAGNSDLIEVTGAAYLHGQVITLASGGNYAAETNYTILTAVQGVAGEFDDISTNLAFLDAALVYNSNDVQLSLTRNGVTFGTIGDTANQVATGDALETLGAGHTIYDRVLTLGADDARAGFDALSGEVHASLDGVLLTQSQLLAQTMGDRVAGAFGQDENGKGLGVWTAGTASVGRLQGDGNAAATSYSAGNLFVGADAMFNKDWMFGVALGYGQTGLSVADRDSTATSDNYYAGIYGGGEAGNFTFKFGAGYTQHDIDTTRTAAMPGFNETMTSERSAGTGQIFGEIGHKFSFDSGLVIEPFANLAHANLYTGAYAEDGGFAALSGAAHNAGATNVTLGLRAETSFALGDVAATAKGMVGWQHGMGGVLPTATHAFSTGDAFTVAGSAMARDSALVEAGLDLRLTPSANLGVTYNGQFGSGQQHGIKANLSVKF